MKTILQNKVKFLMLVFLACFISAYAGPGAKSGNSSNKPRHEFRTLKGVCNCYKDRNYKKKISKPSARYKEYQLRNHKPNV